jgi:RimJ/RimL family protein N-acetyltransferase
MTDRSDFFSGNSAVFFHKYQIMSQLSIVPIQIIHAETITNTLQKYPEITNFLPFSVPDQIKNTEEFIGYLSPQKDRVWSIFSDENFVGVVGLHEITERRPEGKWVLRSATLGYWLSPTFQRQGIGTRAAQFAIDFAFDEMKLHKLKAQHIYDNMASKALLQKMGFQVVGLSRKEAFFDGKWWDEMNYELINPQS